jgi:hypothetical protein
MQTYRLICSLKGGMTMKGLKMSIQYWFDEKTGQITILGKDHKGQVMWSSVSNNPESKRYHPNLYRKLAQRLKDEGKM